MRTRLAQICFCLQESSWGVAALAMTDEGMLMIGNGNGYISVRRIPERILAQAR